MVEKLTLFPKVHYCPLLLKAPTATKFLYMREAIRDKNRLKHILENIEKIQEAVEGYNFEQLNKDHIRFAAISL